MSSSLQLSARKSQHKQSQPHRQQQQQLQKDSTEEEGETEEEAQEAGFGRATAMPHARNNPNPNVNGTPRPGPQTTTPARPRLLFGPLLGKRELSTTPLAPVPAATTTAAAKNGYGGGGGNYHKTWQPPGISGGTSGRVDVARPSSSLTAVAGTAARSENARPGVTGSAPGTPALTPAADLHRRRSSVAGTGTGVGQGGGAGHGRAASASTRRGLRVSWAA